MTFIRDTGELILPEELSFKDLGSVLREVRIRGEVTRYEVEKATGQHYIAKLEQEGFSTVHLRTLLKWCEVCEFEVVLRPITREERVDPKKLTGEE